MKINPILSLISCAIAALLGYLAFSVAVPDENSLLCGVASGVCFFATLLPLMGLSCESSRLKTNINVFAGMFFFLFAVSHFCFAAFGVSMPFYIILNGILLLVYIASLYKMQGIKDI